MRKNIEFFNFQHYYFFGIIPFQEAALGGVRRTFGVRACCHEVLDHRHVNLPDIVQLAYHLSLDDTSLTIASVRTRGRSQKRVVSLD